MHSKSEAGHALKDVIQDVGIPKEIHSDGAKERTMGTWNLFNIEYLYCILL
jgi:hypothetical protein